MSAQESQADLDEDQLLREKETANAEVRAIMRKLEDDYPGITEGMATALGVGVGGAGSLAALSALGVSGLSAAGITSGLATAGALVGGGMVAGIGVLAAPIALLGVAGYAVAKRYKNAQLAAALGQAIAKLHAILERLLANAEYFKEEIAGIKVAIDILANKKTS
jgi:hypothetical protein